MERPCRRADVPQGDTRGLALLRCAAAATICNAAVIPSSARLLLCGEQAGGRRQSMKAWGAQLAHHSWLPSPLRFDLYLPAVFAAQDAVGICMQRAGVLDTGHGAAAAAPAGQPAAAGHDAAGAAHAAAAGAAAAAAGVAAARAAAAAEVGAAATAAAAAAAADVSSSAAAAARRVAIARFRCLCCLAVPLHCY